jgi:hypothetical protein
MQGIYTYIPQTIYVPREHSVAAILLFLFMVHTSLAPVLNLLHFYISTFRSMCAVPNMDVFCSSVTLCIPGTLLRCFLNVFEMVPVARIITGTTFIVVVVVVFFTVQSWFSGFPSCPTRCVVVEVVSVTTAFSWSAYLRVFVCARVSFQWLICFHFSRFLCVFFCSVFMWAFQCTQKLKVWSKRGIS